MARIYDPTPDTTYNVIAKGDYIDVRLANDTAVVIDNSTVCMLARVLQK